MSRSAYRVKLEAASRSAWSPAQAAGWQYGTCRSSGCVADVEPLVRPAGWAGRHRKRLEHLTAEKAYGSKANRRSLRARRFPHTIPERADVRASRARKGLRGGRLPTFNPAR